MKILVVGAGALGGYYGGRLLEAGQDVTFLLRQGRIEQIKKSNGLHIKSSFGDMHFPDVKITTSEQIKEHFDLIIVSCKAYSLTACMESFAAAVGPKTMILPVLNGMSHIDILSKRFDKKNVIGGLALISASLDAEGKILHLNQNHGFTYGELDGQKTPRIQAVQQAFEKASFASLYSDNIMQAMWNKWVMISTAVSTTCLFRGAICDVVNANGADFISAILDECLQIAADNNHQLNDESSNNLRTNMTSSANTLKASMMMDMEKGLNIEIEAIIGDLIKHAATPEQTPLLKLVYTHLKTYLVRLEREKA